MPIETVRLEDESRASWSDPSMSRPVTAHIWPARGRGEPAPLILLSHGTGGAAEDLDWLAGPLNEAGYLVAAVDHHGNSYNDEYLVEGFAFTWERPRDISFVLDHAIAAYDVDTSRIGAAGFSIGGYTVAALLGATIDPQAMEAVLCGIVPAPELPEFPDLVKALHTDYSDSMLSAKLARSGSSVADERISSGFAIAPAIGRLIDTDSLASITRPLEIRWGEADRITPPEDNAHIYLHGVETAQGHSVGSGVVHYDFLGDRDDPFDARRQVAADSLSFFASTL